MLKKYGPDDPGTINAKRQLDEQTKAISGAKAIYQDKVDQGLIIPGAPKAPAPRRKSDEDDVSDRSQDQHKE